MIPAIEVRDALFLDFDGSLVEIAATPADVAIDPGLPQLLDQAAARLNGALAVISGRPLADLSARLEPFRGAAAGIHGLERRRLNGKVVRPILDGFIARARPFLRQFAAVEPGVLLEDKDVAFSLHYRGHPDRAEACLDAARHAQALSNHQLTILQGKMVVELRPRAANKGRAILEYLGEPPFRGRRPVFLGDDSTDEEGFSVVNRLGGLTIHVGPPNGTAARFDLPDVSAVLAWITDFAEAGPARSLDATG
jgi:trehalose 6-phosphate phosphatase